MEKIAGIYMIKNKINEKIYVGQTDDIDDRRDTHFIKLRKQAHENPLLQEDFNIYGEKNFEFKLIVECEIEQLDNLEKLYIEKLNSFEDNGGYNIANGGKTGFKFSKGYIERRKKRLSEDFSLRKQISDSMKEHWNNDELKKNKSEEVKERYKDQSERKKTAEATKKGMARLPKEKLSREHLSPYSKETLIEMTKNTHLTQKQLAEKFEVPLSMAKSIKAKSHWIYKYM